jgi:hypothetical protein
MSKALLSIDKRVSWEGVSRGARRMLLAALEQTLRGGVTFTCDLAGGAWQAVVTLKPTPRRRRRPP